MKVSLSLAIAFALAMSLVRVQTGIPILYLVLPGYAAALILSFFVPPIFTAIAFDAGGVASGPMTATFLLPLAMGACSACGRNLLTDAFGLVAMVAMMPLLTVQVMGVIFKIRAHTPVQSVSDTWKNEDIIELWEVQ